MLSLRPFSVNLLCTTIKNLSTRALASIVYSLTFSSHGDVQLGNPLHLVRVVDVKPRLVVRLLRTLGHQQVERAVLGR